MRPHQIISLLSEYSGRLDKERIIQDAWDAGCFEFFLGAQMAYDKLITYGVKKVPASKSTENESGLGWSDFYELADKLRKRELTGNAALDELEHAASMCSEEEWDGWYRLILMKDFKCGVTSTTINNVLKNIIESEDFNIPVFSCQLAHPSENHPKKMVGTKLLDVKLDGVRILAVCNIEKGTVTLHTRNGNIKTNFPTIEERMKEILPYLTESMVFDGEMISRSFQDLMTQFNRKKDIDTSDSRYALFDMVPLKDFLSGKHKLRQEDRDKNLMDFVNEVSHIFDETIYRVPKVKMDIVEDHEAFEKFNRQAIEAGYEGIMIKDPDAPYVCKKGTNWMKLKPTITVDLTIVDFELGEPGKQFENSLGAFVCEGVDEDRFIKVNVSGGLTPEQRDEFWNNRDNIRGFIAEIKADAVTQDKDGNYSLRFPRFVRFRGDVPGEKY